MQGSDARDVPDFMSQQAQNQESDEQQKSARRWISKYSQGTGVPDRSTNGADKRYHISSDSRGIHVSLCHPGYRNRRCAGRSHVGSDDEGTRAQRDYSNAGAARTGQRVHLSQRQRQPVHVKSRDESAAAVWTATELLASRDARRQCPRPLPFQWLSAWH